MTPHPVIASGPLALVGEALAGGTVILAWDCVLRDGKERYAGHNLVYHEFAHKLDMLDGQSDGTPPLASRAAQTLESANYSRSLGRNCVRAKFLRACLLREGLLGGPLLGARIAGVCGMSKPIPSVQKYMTTSPHTVGVDQTLAHAHGILREHKIRHLPVLRGGELVGMLTERDLALIETLKDVDPTKLLVEDAMSTSIFTVSPDAGLDQVVSEMAAKKYGSAVVVQNHHVVGILTNVDVCAAFAELLKTRLAK